MLISPTLANNNTNNSNNNSNSNNVTKIDKLSSNLSPLTQMFNYLKFIHIFSEYLLVCYVAYYLWFTIIRLIRSSGFDSFCRSLAQAPEMSLFTVTCLLILVCIPFRLIGWKRYEDFMAALVMFTLPLKLLFFCRASMSVGSFVVMIYKIVVNDVLCFVVFLIIFVAGFSQCKLCCVVFCCTFVPHSQFQLELRIASDNNIVENTLRTTNPILTHL